MLLLLTLMSTTPLFAQHTVRFGLPDKAEYLLTMTASESGKAGNKASARKSQVEGRVLIDRETGGYRLTIEYRKHFETVNGMPPGSDLTGLALAYHLDPFGNVIRVEGVDEFVHRTTAPLQRVAPSLATPAAAAQATYWKEQCDVIAATLFGKTLQPGDTWTDSQRVLGSGFRPHTAQRKLRATGFDYCGLGKCLKVEGTYQVDFSAEAKEINDAVILASPGDRKPAAYDVYSGWDSGRVLLEVHPETGLIARRSEYVAVATEVFAGAKPAREERVRTLDVKLEDPNKRPPPPVRATIVGGNTQ